jgi:VWFA-related protein
LAARGWRLAAGGLVLPLALVLVIVVGAGLQARPWPQAGNAAPQTPTFRASTRLILTTVSVKHPDGTPVEGLTAKDFVLTEDGEPQDIAFVQYQRLDAPAPLPALALQLTDTGRPIPISSAAADPIVQPGINVPASGDERFRNRRLIILLFDLSDPPGPSQQRMFTGALAYLNAQMTRADLVAVMTYSGGAVRVKQDFTDDREKLGTVIDILANGVDADGDGQADFADFGSAFGQDDEEFNVFGTDRKLAALQTAVTMLRPLPEQKSLVFFTSSFQPRGTDNIAQMRATTNAAIRANVQIFPVDARGLVARAPLGNASQRSPGGLGTFNGTLAQQAITRFQESQDALLSLAKDTGGKALIDYNDLSVGVKQAADAQISYYILGFYSTHDAKDGRYRRIVVKLADQTLKAELAYRPGYYAEKEWAKQNAVERERQLEDALMLEDPITDIPIAMELNYFKLSGSEYFVPIAAKIPSSELKLAQRHGGQRMTLDVLIEVKDNFGATQRNMRDRLEVPLTNAKAEQLAAHPIQYETGFTLLPGKYVMKLLIRDSEVGRIGTYQTPFTIPNLNREPTRLPLSTVVLGSQRMPVNDALYSVKTADKQSIGHPLIESGQKLLPSVTRVFSASRDIYVYLEAYEAYAATTQPLIAFATLYRDGLKAFETRPVEATAELNRTSKPVPIRFAIPVDQVPSGKYDCQITVLDPLSGKAGFWSVPIAIVP